MLVQTSQWLQKMLYGMLILILAYMGGYAALYRFSEHHQLQGEFEKLLQTTGRQITFDTNIKRRLFPRPTLILSNVRLSEADGQTEAFYAQEVRIGMAWQNLVVPDKREIEKLVLEHAQLNLHLNQNGHWNIRDLWTLPQSDSSFTINRLHLNDAQMNINTHQEQLQLHAVNWVSERTNHETHHYRISAQATYPLWEEMALQAEGYAQIATQSLQLPDAEITFQGKQDSYNFSGSLKTVAAWQNQQFTAEKTRINLKSKRFNSNIDTTIASILGKAEGLRLQGINTVFNLNSGSYQHTGSLSISNAQGHRSAFTGEAITLSLKNEHTVSGSLTDITLNGSGTWLKDNGINLPDLKLTTLQTTTNNPSHPLLASEWEGSIHWDNVHQWNLQFKGLFERQPAIIEMAQQDKTILGQFKLNKLDLNKYFNEQNKWQGQNLPQWSPKDFNFQIGLEIGELKLPELTVINLHSQVSADAQQMVFEPLSAELFGGQSTGNLTIYHTTPMHYHLTQHSQNVQVGQLLQQLFGISRIQGVGNVILDFNTQGSNHKEMLSRLSGSLKLDVYNGEWLGFDVKQLFKNITETSENTISNPTNLPVSHEPTSHFRTFHLSSQIQNGISRHTFNGMLNNPLAKFNSEGEIDLKTGLLNENLIIHTGNERHALPLRLSGKYDAPSISLNYQQMTAESKTPEEKQKTISETLKQQWQWLRGK